MKTLEYQAWLAAGQQAGNAVRLKSRAKPHPPSENATPAISGHDSTLPKFVKLSDLELDKTLPPPPDDNSRDDQDAGIRLSLIASEALGHLLYLEAMPPSPPYADSVFEESEEHYGCAYFDFEDSQYVVQKECVIIGRAPESHLTLVEVPNHPTDVGDGTAATNRNKRKRLDVDDDSSGPNDDGSQPPGPLFRGGLGGPQEHGASYIDQGAEFIYIWPPADLATSPPNIKAISKRHLRLNFDGDDQWQLDVLGRNGVLINRDFYPQGSQVMLQDGDHFWVGAVNFSFNIPDAAADEYEYSGDEDGVNGELYDSAEADSNEESYEFVSDEEEEVVELNNENEDEGEDEDGEDSAVSVSKPSKTGKRVTKPKSKQQMKSSSKRGKMQRSLPQSFSESQEEQESIEIDSPIEKVRPAKTSKGRAQKGERKPPPASEDANVEDDDAAPKKRGPGRPPKDGVMSKRARRALQKAAELDRNDGDVAAGKVKGRSRKVSDANGQDASEQTKKVKKSKRKASDATGIKDEDEKLGDAAKEKPAPAPPREPSPKESDFQEHELQKPDKPYSVCLYNVLRETGHSMALPEIYEAFKKRWPYYRFRTGGDGWQSSIRHNLQSTRCLVKDGKAGKGHLWTVDPTIPLDNRANTRSEMPNLPQGYYGQQGRTSSSMLSGQNQHLPMRAPTNSGGFGHQNMHQYHFPYVHGVSNGQRPPPVGPNPSMQQYQSSNGNAGQFVTQNQGQVNAQRPIQIGAGPPGVASQTGLPVQNTGRFQNSTPSQTPSNQAMSAAPNSTSSSILNLNQGRENGIQPGTVPNSQLSRSSGSNGGMFSPEKQQAFDVFRNKLLSMAQNLGQRNYYIDILDLGEAWCAQHAELNAQYDGPRRDVGQIVKAFQESWEVQLKRNEESKDPAQGVSSTSSPKSAPALSGNSLPQTNDINSTANVSTVIKSEDAKNPSNNVEEVSKETSRAVVPSIKSKPGSGDLSSKLPTAVASVDSAASQATEDTK